jgi:hypothetical protein
MTSGSNILSITLVCACPLETGITLLLLKMCLCHKLSGYSLHKGQKNEIHAILSTVTGVPSLINVISAIKEYTVLNKCDCLFS